MSVPSVPFRFVPAALLAACLAVALALVPSASAAPRVTASLAQFDGCADLVQFARAGVARRAIPVRAFSGGDAALSPRAPRPESERQVAVSAPPAASPTAVSGDQQYSGTFDGAAEAAPVAGKDFSGTNVQEEGIDEPDVVKTDGKRLFVLAGDALWAFDVTKPVPALLGKLDVAEVAGGELLLRGGRLLLIGNGNAGSTRLVEVDTQDPAALKILRTMTVPGRPVTARLTGGTIRIVLSSPSTTEQPTVPGGPIAIDTVTPPGRPVAVPTVPAPRTRAATAAAAKVKTPKVNQLIPRTTLRSKVSGRTFRRQLVACGQVRHPAVYEGLDLLTVLSVDFDHGLFNVDRDAILAGAQVVYASETGLYVGSSRAAGATEPADIPAGAVTEIHRFDTSTPGQTSYVSSGTVPGFVLNQYALSEFKGVLRVASTTQPTWIGEVRASAPQASQVTVLREAGSRLERVGQVGNLGQGERIYATRFIGDTGYVVTFRQTDPLYTLDLSDPAAPKVVGELKIAGYSAYLHPVGDDLLLGVGQDATETGSRLGGQVSLFDVKDPAKPARLAAQPLGGASSSSSVEFDPHAFLWWPGSSLAVLPVTGWDMTTNLSTAGALGVKATRAGGLAEVGRITHGPDWDRGEIARSLVVGDRVITVSPLGVAASALSDLSPVGFAPFAVAVAGG